MLSKIISSRRNYLQKQIQFLQNKIAALPPGGFYCYKDGKRVKWIFLKDSLELYLHKSDRPFAEKLATKKFLSLFLKDFEQELSLLEDFSQKHNSSNSETALKLLAKPEYFELISPIFKPLSQELSEWANMPFPSNPAYPELLVHDGSNGKKVRSKSESIIDLLLTTHGIPFHYEELLVLGSYNYYPDFTIRHPVTGEIYYWEHFGRMDNPEYIKKCINKLNRYAEHGIFPGDKLIVTYESADHPLSIEHVRKTIQHFFG